MQDDGTDSAVNNETCSNLTMALGLRGESEHVRIAVGGSTLLYQITMEICLAKMALPKHFSSADFHHLSCTTWESSSICS